MLNGLASSGDEVTFLSLDRPPAALSSSVRFRSIPFPLKKRAGFIFWALFTLWAPFVMLREARRYSCDRIVVFGAYYAFISLLARAATGARLILFVRSLVFRINRLTAKPPLLIICSDMLERIGLRSADAVVAMSNSMADELNSFSGRKCVTAILPNDVPERQSITDDTSFTDRIKKLHSGGALVVLISGVFDQRKNLSGVLEAFRLLNLEAPENRYHLVIAGVGPELSAAEQFIRSNRPGFIHTTGWISLDSIYPFVSLVIHPSHHEGMPNSVLEAWAWEIPTLLAPTPELKEMAPHADLWLPDVSGRAIADRLLQISADPTHLERLRQAVRQCATPLRFDWEARAREVIA